MLFASVLSFALLASASPLEARKACCEVKCYKRLDYADRHDEGDFRRDCQAYQRTTITPCAKTVYRTRTADAVTVTRTVYPGENPYPGNHHHHHPGYPREAELPAIAHKKGAVGPRAVAGRHCPVVNHLNHIPRYAYPACNPREYAAACSCLGVLPTTTTVRARTTTETLYRVPTVTVTSTFTGIDASTTSSSTTSSTISFTGIDATSTTSSSSSSSTSTSSSSTISFTGIDATSTTSSSSSSTSSSTTVSFTGIDATSTTSSSSSSSTSSSTTASTTPSTTASTTASTTTSSSTTSSSTTTTAPIVVPTCSAGSQCLSGNAYFVTCDEATSSGTVIRSFSSGSDEGCATVCALDSVCNLYDFTPAVTGAALGVCTLYNANDFGTPVASPGSVFGYYTGTC